MASRQQAVGKPRRGIQPARTEGVRSARSTGSSSKRDEGLSLKKTTGVVIFFKEEKRYGFIRADEGVGGERGVFFHQSAIITPGRRALKEKEKVRFDLVDHPKGLRAENVEVI